MSIKIIQTCDKCENTRTLAVGYHGGRSSIKAAACVGGWVELEEFKHICHKCVRKILENTEESSNHARNAQIHRTTDS